eukprot:TRINITY_DN10078_c0_g3_i2.p1 TRINITY_DN10078_c0_g3~~TRINITY_DN10078_c0_g3_i2.p1  ORF type:complete len:373 (+),score=90.43 TRINITY_DN10078_c0_g3_i2:132-1250(+)
MKKKIGEYIMGELIGSRPYDEVYKGFSTRGEKKTVVVKMVPIKNVAEKLIKSIENEVEMLKTFDHPNIIKLIDFCSTENHYYVITEHCNGNSLSAFRKRKGGAVSEDTVRFLLRQIVEGLSEVHSKNVVFGDIKLSKIFLSYSSEEAKVKDEPVVKLGGFKFARAKTEEQGESFFYADASTNTAPELFGNCEPTVKSDIWSLGTIVYELLCGESCISGINKKQLKLCIEKGIYEIPKHLNLSTECLDFLNACLQVDLNSRIGWESLLSHEFIATNKKTVFSPELFRKANKILKGSFEVNDNFIFSNKIRHTFPTFCESTKEELKRAIVTSESEDDEYIEVNAPLDTPKKMRTIERIESNGFIVLTSIQTIEP